MHVCVCVCVCVGGGGGSTVHAPHTRKLSKFAKIPAAKGFISHSVPFSVSSTNNGWRQFWLFSCFLERQFFSPE
jgi:hypothetical protein